MNSTDIVALAFSGQCKSELTFDEIALLMASVGVSHPESGRHDAALSLLNRLVGVEGLKTHTRTRFIEVPGEWRVFVPYTEDMRNRGYVTHHLREAGRTGTWERSTGARPEGAEPNTKAVEERCVTAEAMDKCLAGLWGEEIRAQGFESRALLKWIEASGVIAAKVADVIAKGTKGRVVTRKELLEKGYFQVKATGKRLDGPNCLSAIRANLKPHPAGQYSIDEVKEAALSHKGGWEFVWPDDE